MLYWAEGGKKARSFQFVNSDWRIIQLMLRFLREIAKIDEELIKIRLYIHEIYKDENCEKFWLEITQISPQFLQKTIYKPSLHKVKKNKNYKGCCRIEITQSEIYWKIIKWQELLFEQI